MTFLITAGPSVCHLCTAIVQAESSARRRCGHLFLVISNPKVLLVQIRVSNLSGPWSDLVSLKTTSQRRSLVVSLSTRPSGMTPSALGQTRASLFRMWKARAYCCHFSRRLDLAPVCHFCRDRAVSQDSIRKSIVHSVHPSGLRHLSPSSACEKEAAPARGANEEDATHDGKSDGKS